MATKSTDKNDDDLTSSNPARAAGKSKPTEAEVNQAKANQGDTKRAKATDTKRDSGQPAEPTWDDQESVVDWLLEAGLSTDERTRRIHAVEGNEIDRQNDGKEPRSRVGDALNGARSQPGMGYDSATEQP